MLVSYRVLLYIVIFEFLLILALIVFTILFRLGSRYWKRRREKQKMEFRGKIISALNSREPIDYKSIKKKWGNLKCLLVWFRELDKENLGEKWERRKNEFVEELILPLCRKYVGSYLWTRRFLAAKGFSYGSDLKDQKSIIKLLQDRVPLIHFEAMLSVRKSPTKHLVNAFIDQMALQPGKTHVLYCNICSEIADVAHVHIRERLIREEKPLARATCYQLLNLQNAPKIEIPSSVDDILSTNRRLSVAAIQFVARIRDKNALQALIKSLESDKSKVVSESILALKELGIDKAIPKIQTFLSSRSWAIRASAATALKSFGEKGVKVLKKSERKEDKKAKNIAQFLLSGRNPDIKS